LPTELLLQKSITLGLDKLGGMVYYTRTVGRHEPLGITKRGDAS